MPPQPELVLISKLVAEKRLDEVEELFRDALSEPVAKSELLLTALKALARVTGQKARLQTLAGAAELELKPQVSNPAVAKVRWNLLKEAVRAGATPSTTEGFHKLFEEAISAAYPTSSTLGTLLGRFKFRETKTPADGLTQIERAEKWLPFEVGRCFSMPGRGAGKVVETNYQLDSVRLDFEKVRGVAIPIGVASKNLVQLPEGHFLKEKLSDPAALGAMVVEDPVEGIKWLLTSFGRPMTMSEVKDAVSGLVPEESWSSWWTNARKGAQVVVSGSGKNALVEWSASAGAADLAVLARFERAPLKEKIDLYKKSAKRSPEIEAKMGERLAAEARRLKASDPAKAFELAVLVDKAADLLPELVPKDPLPLLSTVNDRVVRERLLELHARKFPEQAVRAMTDWFFREDDGRTLDILDKRLSELDPSAREWILDRLLKSPRQGPRAFIWLAQRAAQDEALRARLNSQVLGRLLDAVSWDELGALRTKVREMFDRTGIAAIWLVKQATVDEARTFLESLSRHHELEPHRRDALVAAAEMRFPDLRKTEDATFFATPESIDAKRRELEHILQVEIPENTKGIALAAAEGDLSENFEYKARRDKQQLLSVRAGKLQRDLALARPLTPGSIETSEVRPGTRVTLSGPRGRRTMTLLGPWDSDPENNVFSHLSDAGKALLGKRPGETAGLLGEVFTVETIEPWRSGPAPETVPAVDEERAEELAGHQPEPRQEG